MPWIRIDDHFDEHPKLAAAGPLGWALWLAGLAYCNRNLTDGFIPWPIARKLVSWDNHDGVGQTRIYIGSEKAVDEECLVSSEYVIELLIANGIWDEVEGGYRVHDFDKYQPTKAAILAERSKKAAAGQAGGIAAAVARAKAPAIAESKPVPKPNSNPVSVLPNSVPRARAKLDDVSTQMADLLRTQPEYQEHEPPTVWGTKKAKVQW